MSQVSARLANMRKPQSFVVSITDKGGILVQSDKSIGLFNPTTGKGVLNTKGCCFSHLHPDLGAKLYEFPAEFISKCLGGLTWPPKNAYPKWSPSSPSPETSSKR